MERPRLVARTGTDNAAVDYVPVTRAGGGRTSAEPGKTPLPGPEAQIDYLDIPAFLRRQAD
jgi:cell division protein FtsZ